MHRLHIDIPLGHSLDTAILTAKRIIEEMQKSRDDGAWNGDVDLEISYRLGIDGQRKPTNYLALTPEGHATHGKSKA